MIILLDDTSKSFCHYEVNKSERQLISIDDLKAGIHLAMIENLTIQFVYPDYDLPQEYKDVIHTIDHSNIMPASCIEEADVLTLEEWPKENQSLESQVVVLRTPLQDLITHEKEVKEMLRIVQRLNIVITDVEKFTDGQKKAYRTWLGNVGSELEALYVNGKSPQFNLLTDRMMLTNMNNCGAGDSCITLAPNGKFYVCPAFYYENNEDNSGDLIDGIDIKNKQLFQLDHAPICRICDAWQCKRCVWLNRKMTLDVNTPSHEQCVMAHLERDASRELLANIRKQGTFLPDNPNISGLDYLDPFEIINK